MSTKLLCDARNLYAHLTHSRTRSSMFKRRWNRLYSGFLLRWEIPCCVSWKCVCLNFDLAMNIITYTRNAVRNFSMQRKSTVVVSVCVCCVRVHKQGYHSCRRIDSGSGNVYKTFAWCPQSLRTPHALTHAFTHIQTQMKSTVNPEATYKAL